MSNLSSESSQLRSGRAEMELSEGDLRNAGKDEERRKLLEYFSKFIPERAAHARYQDGTGRNWEVVVYDYNSTGRAWNTWLFLSWTVGLSGQSISLQHGNGMYADSSDGRALLIH